MEFKKTARRLGRKTKAAVRAGGQALAKAPRALKRRYNPTTMGARHARASIRRQKVAEKINSVIGPRAVGKVAWGAATFVPRMSWRAGRGGAKAIRGYSKGYKQAIHQERVRNFEKNTTLGRFGARVKKAWATRRAKYGKKGSAK